MPNVLRIPVPASSAALVWPGRPGQAPGVNTLLLVNTDSTNTIYVSDISSATANDDNTIPIPPSGSISVDPGSPWYTIGSVAGINPLVMVPNGQSYFLPASLSQIGGAKIFVQGTTPTGTIPLNSIWIDTVNGSINNWNGTTWVQQEFNATNLIQAGTIIASLIEANTITAAQLAAGIVYAGIIDGTTVNAATFNGSTFNGTNFSINANGAFFNSGIVLNADGQFVYNGAPAEGNLIASIAPVGGTDSQGNTYGGGVSVYGEGNSQTTFGLFNTEPVIVMTPTNTIDAGYEPPQIVAAYQGTGDAAYFEVDVNPGSPVADADTPTSAIILYSPSSDGTTSIPHVSVFGGVKGDLIADFDNSGLTVATNAGISGKVPIVQVDNTADTNANNGTQPCTMQWEIPAGDAQVGTVYEIQTRFAGKTATSGPQTLGFKPSYNGTALTTSNGDTIGGTAIAADTGFTGKIRLLMKVITTGASGTANIFMDGGYAQEANIQAGSGTNSGYMSSQVTGVALETTVNNTIAIDTVWGGSSAGQTVTAYGSEFARRGP